MDIYLEKLWKNGGFTLLNKPLKLYKLPYDAIYNRIRYLISEKSGITDIINHNFARIRIDSCNSLPIEKTLTFHNVIIFIKLVVNKNQNDYYYNIFL